MITSVILSFNTYRNQIRSIGQIGLEEYNSSQIQRTKYIELNQPGAEYAIAFGNTGGGSAAGEIMRLLGTGNVGIGVTSPGVKLDVDGDVRLSGLLTLGTHANAPSTTLNGSMYYNTTTNSLNLYKNGWI